MNKIVAIGSVLITFVLIFYIIIASASDHVTREKMVINETLIVRSPNGMLMTQMQKPPEGTIDWKTDINKQVP